MSPFKANVGYWLWFSYMQLAYAVVPAVEDQAGAGIDAVACLLSGKLARAQALYKQHADVL